MNTKSFMAGCVVISVLLAGCVPSGDEIQLEFHGELNTTGEEFHMQGRLIITGGTVDRTVYRDVAVILYSKERTVLYRETLGDLTREHAWLNVSISTAEPPEYVIFDSRDFYHEDMKVEYLKRDDGQYLTKRAGSRDALPVNATADHLRN